VNTRSGPRTRARATARPAGLSDAISGVMVNAGSGAAYGAVPIPIPIETKDSSASDSPGEVVLDAADASATMAPTDSSAFIPDE
jgi:hypothetical protein